MIRIVVGEGGRRRSLHKVRTLMESAKWNMYAELWKTAQNELEEARELAVSLRDKGFLDEILMLLGKCRDREKPEINS